MSLDLDNPPIYDYLVKDSMYYMSDAWVNWITTLVQTLTDYLSQNGIFLPNLTNNQIGQIQSPVNGQLLYNITVDAPQFYQSSSNSWRTVSFT